MTSLEFAAAVISSLAWPMAVVLTAILLREPLRGLLPLVRRLKYKDLEIEFSEEVKELRDQADAALPALPPGAPIQIPEETRLLELASVSPRSSVVEAWRLVESAARDALERRGEQGSGRPLFGAELTRTLMRREVLDNASRDVFDRLRMLRNQAVHVDEFHVDEAAAREYAHLALALARRFRAVA